jgi:hypothetical protein
VAIVNIQNTGRCVDAFVYKQPLFNEGMQLVQGIIHEKEDIFEYALPLVEGWEHATRLRNEAKGSGWMVTRAMCKFSDRGSVNTPFNLKNSCAGLFTNHILCRITSNQ